MKNRLIKTSLYKKNNKYGLTYVIEKQIPFKIKRVFFKYKFKESGNHINKITNMALICVSGKISVFIKNLDDKDPKVIVIDEFIGQSIPICLYEIAHETTNDTSQVLTFYFIMFILFRIFDITKPYPVSYYDKKFKNSFGVVMDDVCAGLYVVGILVLYMVITS